MSPDDLATAPNIGPKLAAGLREVGIGSMDELRAVGAVDAWDRLRGADLFDCVNSMLALEGAIEGVRWHHLPAEQRQALTTHVHDQSVGGRA